MINVPFTTFLGIRFDERYGDTFVYLRENKGKRILHEFHPGPGSITKHKNVSTRKLRAIRNEIAEYDKDMEECDDGMIDPLNPIKKTSKKKLESGMPMFI